MCSAPRVLDAQLQTDLAELQSLAVPGVHDLHDVRSGLGDELRDAGELSRPVWQRNADRQITTGSRETVRDDALQQQGVDVPPGEHGQRLAGAADLAGEDRGDADSARRLHDDLRLLEQNEDRPGDVVVADRDDLVDEVLDDLEWHSPGLRHEDAVGDRRARLDLHGMPRGERRRNRRGVLCLHADHANSPSGGGRGGLRGGGDPGDDAAPADADQDRVDIRRILDQLKAERALPDHDVAVVEGMDHDGAGALRELGGQAQRRGDRLALEHDLGAVAAGREQLGNRNAQRHEDRGRDSERLSCQRDTLRVVARRCRDHAV